MIVIVEHAPGITLDAYTTRVLANLKNRLSNFRVVDQQAWSKGVLKGHLVHTKGKVNNFDFDLEYYHALFVDKDLAFQIVAFAAEKTFPEVKDEFEAAISSFSTGDIYKRGGPL